MCIRDREYEQSIGRTYQANPWRDMWSTMRQLTNRHISGLDLDNPINVAGPNYDTIYYNRKYVADDQSVFDKNLREALGLNPTGTDFIDIDNLDPSTFSLDMFSPDEDDINFISDEDFSKMFDLKGENKITIRTLFNEKIRAIITKNSEWNWKFDGNQIMVSYELEKRGAVNDVKSSLGILAELHNELRSLDLTAPISAEELEKDIPDEIIDKKLYRKRMATFGCSMGCGMISLYLGLIFLWETILRRQLDMVFPSLFWAIPGFIALRFGYLEWKRNRQLKKDGKVKEDLND